MSNTAVTAAAALSKDVSLIFFADLVILLLAALACGAVAGKIGLPKMVGEIAAGILLGPTVFGRLFPETKDALFPSAGTGSEIISGLCLLAVVLLVGVAGMHVDVDKLKQRLAGIATISVLGLAVPLAGGMAVGYLVPEPLRPAAVDRTVFALFLGTAVAVSAIPVIARILMDLGLASHEIAQVILAAAIVDDVAGWLLLSAVTGMASDSGTGGVAVLKMAVAAIVAVVALTALTRPALRNRLARRCSRWSAPTSTTVTVATIIVCATAGQLLGFEPVIGAFFAGILVIAATPAGSRVHKPLHAMAVAFFGPIFFATIGLQLDLGRLLSGPVLALTASICVVAVLSKFLGAGMGARISGFSWPESVAVGAGLNTRGVIQIVIAMVGVRCGVFSPEVFTALVVTTIATTAIAGPVLKRTLTPRRQLPAVISKPPQEPALNR